MGMLMSIVPTCVGAAENSDPNQNALEMFGFPLDPDSYDTQALKNGTYPVAPRYDLYVDNADKIKKYSAELVDDGTKIYSKLTSTPNMYANKENAAYTVATGFAATYTGVNDHIAKAYFLSGKKGANILLSVYDANGNALVTGFDTGGYVNTKAEMKMWEVEGLLSITAGDFDGDGADEIAVYTPNNAADLEYGKGYLTLSIFEFDAKYRKISLKQSIDITSKTTPEEVCEWEFSRDGSTKQYYCLPYVALSANDLSGDGIDDLSAIVNFSTWFRGDVGDYTKYTTKSLTDHNSRFASVLESYEGKDGGNLEQVIRHRVLVTTPLAGGSEKDQNEEHRYILRNANITVGDVTQEGSKEIIIAGNYSRADVQNPSDDTTTVTSSRYVEVDGNHALCHIVGYTTYNNLKKHNTYDANSDYHWTVQREGNDWTYWYNKDDTDAGPITTSLEAFKYYGTGKPDTIFVGGQLFEYSSEEGKLKFAYDYTGNGKLYHGTNGSKRDTSVVWIGKAVSGNFSDDMFGRETLVFPFYLRVSGKDKHTCKLLTLGEDTYNQDNGGTSTQVSQIRYEFEDYTSHKLVSLALLDGSGRTSYITYPGNDTEVYYSDVEVLSILQAPPLYEELGVLDGGSHIENSSTGFAKSKGSAEGTSHGGSLTAGVVTGFDQDTTFLGLFRFVGAEFEASITGTISYEHSTETSIEYTNGFETSGTKDAVVLFTVPYVRYNCTMYTPEYKLPTEADYNTLCALRDELAQNLENYVNTGNEQINGTYIKGCEYYLYKYSSYVNEANCYDQQDVLYKVAEEIDFIEKAIASFGKGGTGEWGGVVLKAELPYYYSVPQAPILTTVDVETYDAIAEYTPNLEKIYNNVFHEGYKAGDPNTYAHNVSELNYVGEVLQSKLTTGGSSSDGFVTNSNVAAEGSVQSQSISVEKSTSDTIGWGAAVDTTFLAKVGPAKVGFTVTAEYNGSSVRTSTEGNEYSGSVVALPSGSYADYSYNWKLVSYTTKLNGKKVPVVGYLTKINTTPPPSVAQNIKVKDITENSATITWENGDRTADYFKLSRVYSSGGKEYTQTIANNITSDNGSYSYTIKNLNNNTTSYYILESCINNGNYSVSTEKVILTTFPKDFNAAIKLDGMNDSVIYRNGKAFTLSSIVSGNDGYETLYQWQLNKGEGWEDIPGQNNKDFKFTISPLDNGKQVRCSAVVIISGESAYTLFSEPITMNCARSDGDYEVDWEGNNIIITQKEGAESASAFVRVLDSDGKVVDIIHVDGVANLTQYLGKGYDLRLFFLKTNLAPASLPFER